MFARIVQVKDKATKKQRQVVAETFAPPEGFALSDCFTPAVAAQFVEATEEVQAGWLYADGEFTPPPAAE